MTTNWFAFRIRPCSYRHTVIADKTRRHDHFRIPLVIPVLSPTKEFTPTRDCSPAQPDIQSLSPPNLIFFHGSDIRLLWPSFTNPYTGFIRRTIVYHHDKIHARVSGLAATQSAKIAYQGSCLLTSA